MKFENFNITKYSTLAQILSKSILETSEYEKQKDSVKEIEEKRYPNGKVKTIKFIINNEAYNQFFNEDGRCEAYFSKSEVYICDYYHNSYIKFSDCIDKVYMLFKFENGNLIEIERKPLNDSQIIALKNIYLN